MDFLRVEGYNRLEGDVVISGAKNASLPLLASTILSKKEVSISNLPDVVDIKTFIKLLEILGAKCSLSTNSAKIDTTSMDKTTAIYDIVRKMRASVLVLGPLLSRFKECSVSLPGGCAIGQRPVDLHIKAMQSMGADINIEGGYIVASAKKGLMGADVVFDKITVTGTENVIMAAALAKGKTKIVNAAKEPEVVQLCEVLKSGGLDISGIGTSEIVIEGSDGELLEFDKIEVISDRIEAGTYLCAGAITNSNITLRNVNHKHLASVISKLKEMGFGFNLGEDFIEIKAARRIEPVEIVTAEFPGFPTDMQAQFMSLATQAEGSSIIEETLFENRFMHVSELQRLGASIHLRGNTATVNGHIDLKSADVMATDLRASSALVLAALVADGETNIHRIYHLDRGYENLEGKLSKLGAKIERLSE
ncbi:MAG: UDP-N-acetylglucosamine 1-carboxyvinyltransferase [Campylobacterales bacterium]